MKELTKIEIKYSVKLNQCEQCILSHLDEAKKVGIKKYISDFIKRRTES